jgi:phosphohistidine phosphatase|tara:strand:+ start:218 stop:712 length:495 start_codon:yes stop_codon:yes gene_type:complete
MKEIYVLRHAKSSWDNSNLSDFDRPLADRGISDAKKMSNFLKDMNIKIDRVLCSNAIRAKETFDLTADGFNFEIDKATYLDKLYFGDTTTIIQDLKELDESLNNILIVGHNPTLHYLVEILTNESINRFTTCNLATISHDGEWVSLNSQQCSLKSLIRPKELNN